LPCGELVELAAPFPGQAQAIQQVEAGCDIMIGAEEFHGLVGRDVLGQARRLQLHADHIAQLAGVAGRIHASHSQGTAIRSAQALQAFQGAGLAGAIGA